MKPFYIWIIAIILIMFTISKFSSSLYEPPSKLKYCSETYKNNTDKNYTYNEVACNNDQYCKSVTVGDFKGCVGK